MNYAVDANAAIAVPLTTQPTPSPKPQTSRDASLEVVPSIRIDRSRDSLLTDFGKATLEDRYLLPKESYQDMFARVARVYSDDIEHAQRIYDYMSKLWFMPATPVLSNGGAERGLPISCFLNTVNDDLSGIVGTWTENVWLASNGGGIGTYWGKVRSIGEKVKNCGQTSGIIPFVRVMDSLTLAISQGSLRRGSAAVYLDVHHPEIEEFLEIRKPSGDFNRKSLNLHHGLNITDEFMEAVRDDAPFGLRSPKTDEVLKTVNARELWQKILETRLNTGEPYLIFADTVNRQMPKHQRDLGLKVTTSNLCSEIMLHTGPDHLGVDRTAVCCLSSLNVETWDEWNADEQFIPDVMRFLDNVLQSFIDTAGSDFARATYAAMRERSVGLGVMGFHSFLQLNGIPLESVMAKVWNKKMFKHIRGQCDEASKTLGRERGPCPDAADFGFEDRFSNKLAIAPTASISIICGGASPGIEPSAANVYNHKTLSGSFVVRNPYLEKVLEQKGHNNEDTWTTITTSQGSVKDLDCLDDHEKAVFKTAFEIDQRWLVEHAADRTPYICQSQSLNIFLPADVHKRDLHQIHMMAWKRGVKSLYYCRSLSIQRAEAVSGDAMADQLGDHAMGIPTREEGAEAPLPFVGNKITQTNDYEECLSCQ